MYQARGNLETLPVHLKMIVDQCKTVTIDNARNDLTKTMVNLDVFENKQKNTNMPYKKIINRPGVAGAGLQTPLLLIHSFSESVILFLQIFKIS